MPAWKPQWSADGTKIAFLTTAARESFDISDTGNEGYLWLFDLSSQEEIALTRESVRSFAWSPSQERIAYTTGSLSGNPPTLYLWTINSGHLLIGAASEALLVAEINDPEITWAY
jgi:Tol biopolymer transport system component